MRNLILPLFIFSFFCTRYEVKKYYVKPKRSIKEPLLRVLLFEGKNPIYVGGTNIFYAVDAKGKRFKFFASNIIKIKREGDDTEVYMDGKRVNLSLPLLFYPEKGYIKIQGERFRGEIEIDPFLRVINVVKIEDYLRSVVSLEIGSPFLSNFEALKAQAVCARTYALRKYFERRGDFFHLYSDVKDQVYGGRDKENEITDLAVKMTKGEVLLYKNELALTLFHSTCGGETASFDEAFYEKKYIPYLKSIRCNFHGKGLCRESPYYRWERKFSIYEFKEILSKNISNLIGISLTPRDIIDFRISERGESGRVKKIDVKTSKGNFSFKGFDIRKVLGKEKTLPSNFFFFKKMGERVIILGRGFGHGAGLCQYGALALAKKGMNYEYILKFYYPGTRIKKIY